VFVVYRRERDGYILVYKATHISPKHPFPPPPLTVSRHDSTPPSPGYPSESAHTQSAPHPKCHSSTSLSDTTVPSLCPPQAVLLIEYDPPPSNHDYLPAEALRKHHAWRCTVSAAPFLERGGGRIGGATRRGRWSSGGGNACYDTTTHRVSQKRRRRRGSVRAR
jgi:hypothetical protein